MSFLTDLFEGKFGNLGTDITHAPDSLSRHPAEIAETGAAALAALTLGASLPETAGLLGLSGAADLGAEAGLGAAAAEGGTLAADLGLGDIGAGLAGVDAAGFVPDALAFLPGVDLGGGALGFTADSFLPETSTLAELGSDAGGFNIPGATFDSAGAVTDPLSDTALGAGSVTSTPSSIGGGGTSLSDNAFGASAGAAGRGQLATDLGIADIGTGGGGVTGTLGSVLNSPWTRLGLAATPLALAMFRGEPSLPSSAQQAQANAGTLAQFGQQQLAMGQAGQLNAGQLALIQKTQQDLINAARQQFFNMGVQNPQADSRWVQTLANIDTQVTAMTATMIQQEITNGLQALGASSTTLNQIAQLQMQADQNFTKTLVDATKSLGLAAGGGLISTTTTTRAAA